MSANSFGAGGWKTKKFEWDYDKDNPGMIRMQLEARFLRSRTDQDKAEEICTSSAVASTQTPSPSQFRQQSKPLIG